MRVEKREFAWEFSQLSCPGQTRTRVAWELASESLHESFLNSHAPVKWEQELHESWEARVCMRVFSTLVPRSNENKSWWELVIGITSQTSKNSSKFEPALIWRESMKVGGQMRTGFATLILAWSRLWLTLCCVPESFSCLYFPCLCSC
jgi:hypothetical protein